MRNILTTVKKPPGLRWIDLYASEDPVPNGPTRTDEANVPESVRIWNLGSFFADHTAYWDNIEGFVLRVIRACAETAESPWKVKIVWNTRLMEDRAAWRVNCLRFARWPVHLSWFIVGAAVWIQHKNEIWVPFTLPEWLPETGGSIARLAVLTAAVAVAWWISMSGIRLVWQRWVAAEHHAVLVGRDLKNLGFMGPFMVGIVVGIVFGVAGVTVIGVAGVRVTGFSSDYNDLMFIFWMPVALSGIATGILVTLRPPPNIPSKEPSSDVNRQR